MKTFRTYYLEEAYKHVVGPHGFGQQFNTILQSRSAGDFDLADYPSIETLTIDSGNRDSEKRIYNAVFTKAEDAEKFYFDVGRVLNDDEWITVSPYDPDQLTIRVLLSNAK